MPLYYAALAVIFLVVPLFVTITDPETLEFYRHQGWFWAHSINIFFALRGQFLEGGWLSIGHFWSLSVEEHFYLVWPLVVFALRPAALLRFSVACILAAPLLRATILAAGGSIDTVYALTPCRIDGLATGAALACLYADPRWDTWRRRAPAALGLFGAVCTAILVKEHGSAAGRWMSSVGFTFIGLASAAVLALALGPAERILSRFLRMDVLRWFGKYSYGAYVLHQPFEPFIRRWMPSERIAAATGSALVGVVGHTALGIGLSMIAALASWHAFEKHFLKLKRYFEYARPAERSEPAPAVETA
jgi:peptidoglycan/LPS O-acetylase OafA/YrhL